MYQLPTSAWRAQQISTRAHTRVSTIVSKTTATRRFPCVYRTLHMSRFRHAGLFSCIKVLSGWSLLWYIGLFCDIQVSIHVSFQACRSLFLHKGLFWLVSFVVPGWSLLWYIGLFCDIQVSLLVCVSFVTRRKWDSKMGPKMGSKMGPFPMRRKNSCILEFRSLLWYTRRF